MHQKRHRILYIEQPGGVGGTITGLYELIRALDLSQYEPIVLFYNPAHPYCKKFQALGVKVLTLNEKNTELKTIHPQKSEFAAFKRLARAKRAVSIVVRTLGIIKREKIDLVHHNDNLSQDKWTVVAARLANVPQVCHIRTLIVLSALDRFIARFVDKFIYMSKAIEQLYCNSGIPTDKGQVVYDGFDVEIFQQITALDIAKLRAEFSLTDRDFLISNVGRLDSWKGQDYFLEAMTEIIKLYPTTKILLVGTPDLTSPWNLSYYQKLQKMVKDLHLSNHVVMTGYRTDIPYIMAASDVIVHSSSMPEPFGRVIVEGMLSGQPTIATAAGGVLDIIEDGVTGLLIPLQDAKAIAKATLQLLQEREQSKLIGQQAQIVAQKRFSAKQNASIVQEIYQKMVSRST